MILGKVTIPNRTFTVRVSDSGGNQTVGKLGFEAGTALSSYDTPYNVGY